MYNTSPSHPRHRLPNTRYRGRIEPRPTDVCICLLSPPFCHHDTIADRHTEHGWIARLDRIVCRRNRIPLRAGGQSMFPDTSSCAGSVCHIQITTGVTSPERVHSVHLPPQFELRRRLRHGSLTVSRSILTSEVSRLRQHDPREPICRFYISLKYYSNTAAQLGTRDIG